MSAVPAISIGTLILAGLVDDIARLLMPNEPVPGRGAISPNGERVSCQCRSASLGTLPAPSAKRTEVYLASRRFASLLRPTSPAR